VRIDNEGPGVVEISPELWPAKILQPDEALFEDARDEIEISVVGNGYAILRLETVSGGTNDGGPEDLEGWRKERQKKRWKIGI
jgi:hypothetical protein